MRAISSADSKTMSGATRTFDPEIAGLDARSCVYRIYRDLRFSPDKTPYKTYLRMKTKRAAPSVTDDAARWFLNNVSSS